MTIATAKAKDQGKKPYTVRDELRQFRKIFWIAIFVAILHTVLLIVSGFRLSHWLDPFRDIYLAPTALLLVIGLPVATVLLLVMLGRTWRYISVLKRVKLVSQALLILLIVAGYLSSPGGLRSFPIKAIGLYFGDGPKLQAWAQTLLAKPDSQMPYVEEPIGDVVAASANAERQIRLKRTTTPAQSLPTWMQDEAIPNIIYVHRGAENSYVGLLVSGPHGTNGFLVGSPSFSIGYADVGVRLWRGVYYGASE